MEPRLARVKPEYMSAARPLIDYGLASYVITITPLMASIMLTTNLKNRNVRPSLVKKYSRALQRGEWKLNGETIIVGSDGIVLQGQHRLMACRDSKIPLTTIIVCGVDPAAFETIDTGKTRTPNDVFSIAGVKNSSVVSSACTLLFRHKMLGGINHRHVPPSLNELKAMLSMHPELPENCDIVRPIKDILASQASGAALYTLFLEIDKQKTFEFFEMLISGAIGDRHSPVLVLREMLLKQRRLLKAAGGTGAGDGQSKLHPIAMTIKSWNAFVKDAKLKTLSYKTGDKFPVIGTESFADDYRLGI